MNIKELQARKIKKEEKEGIKNALTIADIIEGLEDPEVSKLKFPFSQLDIEEEHYEWDNVNNKNRYTKNPFYDTVSEAVKLADASKLQHVADLKSAATLHEMMIKTGRDEYLDMFVSSNNRGLRQLVVKYGNEKQWDVLINDKSNWIQLAFTWIMDRLPETYYPKLAASKHSGVLREFGKGLKAHKPHLLDQYIKPWVESGKWDYSFVGLGYDDVIAAKTTDALTKALLEDYGYTFD